MSQPTADRLRAIATSVFEGLGLLFVEETGEAEEALVASARVGFSGTAEGHIEVAVTGMVLRELTENMLGTSDEPPIETQLDALGEVANVMCGNLAPALGSEDARPFDLTPPVTRLSPSPTGDDCDVALSIGLGIGRAEVRLAVSDVAGVPG